METLRLLKQEINDTEQLEHDFAKWKLIVAAGLGGAALGLGEGHAHYWLLLFIPFVCAYIDLHCYQYEERVVVLSRFISLYRRRSGAQDDDDAALQAYETHCDRLRREKTRVFDLGEYANLAASTILSVVAPGLAVASSSALRSAAPKEISPALIWLFGIVLIIGQWLYHKHRRDKLEKEFAWTEDGDTGRLANK